MILIAIFFFVAMRCECDGLLITALGLFCIDGLVPRMGIQSELKKNTIPKTLQDAAGCSKTKRSLMI